MWNNTNITFNSVQSSISRLHSERDKAIAELEKAREELERTQATLGKAQLQQDKLQASLDAAHSEIDKLQEKLDKASVEVRKVIKFLLKLIQRYQRDSYNIPITTSFAPPFFSKSIHLFIVVISWFLLQLQVDREKQAYDFESIQSQLDKALGQAARLQKERDTAQLDADRFRDKHDKAQVRGVIFIQREKDGYRQNMDNKVKAF